MERKLMEYITIGYLVGIGATIIIGWHNVFMFVIYDQSLLGNIAVYISILVFMTGLWSVVVSRVSTELKSEKKQ